MRSIAELRPFSLFVSSPTLTPLPMLENLTIYALGIGVAGLVAWLLSTEAAGLTGQGLDINGGAWMG